MSLSRTVEVMRLSLFLLPCAYAADLRKKGVVGLAGHGAVKQPRVCSMADVSHLMCTCPSIIAMEAFVDNQLGKSLLNLVDCRGEVSKTGEAETQAILKIDILDNMDSVQRKHIPHI